MNYKKGISSEISLIKFPYLPRFLLAFIITVLVQVLPIFFIKYYLDVNLLITILIIGIFNLPMILIILDGTRYVHRSFPWTKIVNRLYLCYLYACVIFSSIITATWVLKHGLFIMGYKINLNSFEEEFVIGVGALLAGAISLREVFIRYQKIEKVYITIPVKGLPSCFNGYKILHISDIHHSEIISLENLEREIENINRDEDISLVAITGDLVTFKSSFISPVLREIAKIKSEDGIFLVLGNHDHMAGKEEIVQCAPIYGINVLINEGTFVKREGEKIYIAGIDDPWIGRDDLNSALKNKPDDVFAILLSHTPDIFPFCVSKGVSLVLSGHTHGGQLALPFKKRSFNFARIGTKWTYGLFEINGRFLYVNRGFGSTGVPARISISPEITIITLKRANGDEKSVNNRRSRIYRLPFM